MACFNKNSKCGLTCAVSGPEIATCEWPMPVKFSTFNAKREFRTF